MVSCYTLARAAHAGGHAVYVMQLWDNDGKREERVYGTCPYGGDGGDGGSSYQSGAAAAPASALIRALGAATFAPAAEPAQGRALACTARCTADCPPVQPVTSSSAAGAVPPVTSAALATAGMADRSTIIKHCSRQLHPDIVHRLSALSYGNPTSYGGGGGGPVSGGGGSAGCQPPFSRTLTCAMRREAASTVGGTAGGAGAPLWSLGRVTPGLTVPLPPARGSGRNTASAAADWAAAATAVGAHPCSAGAAALHLAACPQALFANSPPPPQLPQQQEQQEQPQHPVPQRQIYHHPSPQLTLALPNRALHGAVTSAQPCGAGFGPSLAPQHATRTSDLAFTTAGSLHLPEGVPSQPAGVDGATQPVATGAVAAGALGAREQQQQQQEQEPQRRGLDPLFTSEAACQVLVGAGDTAALQRSVCALLASSPSLQLVLEHVVQVWLLYDCRTSEAVVRLAYMRLAARNMCVAATM